MPSLLRTPVRLRLAAAAVTTVALMALAASAMPVLAQDAAVASPASSPQASSVPASPAPLEGAVTLYTSVTQDTVDAVLAAFAEQHPDLRGGGLPGAHGRARRAHRQRAAQRRPRRRRPLGERPALAAALRRRGPPGAPPGPAIEAVPAEYRTPTFVGTRLLNLVIVAGQDVEPLPADWSDLADPAYAGAVAIPDPGFAGSAFAALGYFAGQDRPRPRLLPAAQGQRRGPGGLTGGHRDRRRRGRATRSGISLDKLVRDAIADGAPIELLWPSPGAIAVYSPAAIVEASPDARCRAQAFIEFLVSPEGQAAIAASGWQPVLPDVEWPSQGTTVAPDWTALFGRRQELLEGYRAIFGD